MLADDINFQITTSHTFSGTYCAFFGIQNLQNASYYFSREWA
jgi:hypothetical protein